MLKNTTLVGNSRHIGTITHLIYNIYYDMDIIHQIICIVLYDQSCMTSMTDCRAQYLDTSSCNNLSNEEYSITIDWFHTILNYTMIILNSVMVLTLLRVVNSNSSGDSTGISSRKQFDLDVPSYFATYLCFAFGKLFVLLIDILQNYTM